MATQFAHRVITSVNLPYRTFNSPVSTDPLFESGLNVLTNQKGIAQVFPGFNATLEQVATTFVSLKRIFVWKRWNNGPYIAMFCDIDGTAKVYKYQFGTDTSAVLLFTSASTEPFDFVEDNNWVYFGNGTEMKKYDGTNLKRWGLVKPANAPTVGTSGTGVSTYAAGWFYLLTAYDSATGHESSPSDLSVCTGIISNKTVNIGWTPGDIDTYADKVRIYRTTDGGAADPAEMALVATVAKSVGTYADTTLDAALSSVQFAPPFFRNDPPPPAKGFAKFSGRIYMFNGDTLYFTGREEIADGVPFDCVPGGGDGNFERFDGEITGVAPTTTGVGVFTGKRIWAWDGSTLDTMYSYLLLDRRGCQNRTCVFAIGGSVAWYDTAHQFWLDGREIGIDIRPDLLNVNSSNVSITAHISGEYHWLLLCDAASGKIWPYDLDQGQWMPPRACNARYVWSGNTTDDSIDLLISHAGTKALKMTPNDFRDNGASYASFVVSNLFDMTPQQQPDWRGTLDHMGIESNAVIPDICSVLIDDDPDFAAYTPTAAGIDAPHRKQGVFLKETWYYPRYIAATPAGRRGSFRLDWLDSTTNWKWLSMDFAYRPAVGQ